jgi:hypothetical protein
MTIVTCPSQDVLEILFAVGKAARSKIARKRTNLRPLLTDGPGAKDTGKS